MKKTLFLIVAIIIIFIGHKFSKPKRYKTMNEQILNYVEAQPISNKKAKKLAIVLHGYGANRYDLFDLVRDFSKVLPDTHFILVDAPEPYEGGLRDAYQWFSLKKFNYFAIKPKIKVAHKIFDKFVDQQLQRFELKNKDLILIGFSQGAMMSLYTGLQRKEKINGIVSFSGALPFDRLNIKKKLKSKPNILLIHGTADKTMPYSYLNDAKKLLDEVGISYEAHSIRNMPHAINKEALEISLEFLKNL